MKRIVICLVFMINSATLSAEQPSILGQGSPNVLIFSIDEVALEVNDEVVDGCLPRPSSVLSSAEAAFRRNNISVSTETELNFMPTVYIGALGYAASEYSCVIALSMTLERWSGVSVPHTARLPEEMKTTLAPIRWQLYSTVLTGSKSNMQDRIEREAEKGANKIFITIDRAKDSVESNWPQLWNAAYGDE